MDEHLSHTLFVADIRHMLSGHLVVDDSDAFASRLWLDVRDRGGDGGLSQCVLALDRHLLRIGLCDIEQVVDERE